MAAQAGDVCVGILSVNSGATGTFQPAAGNEVCITKVGSDKVTGASPNQLFNFSIQITDGANPSSIAVAGSSASQQQPFKLFLTNTYYLGCYNADAAAAKIGYSGIYTK